MKLTTIAFWVFMIYRAIRFYFWLCPYGFKTFLYGEDYDKPWAVKTNKDNRTQ